MEPFLHENRLFHLKKKNRSDQITKIQDSNLQFEIWISSYVFTAVIRRTVTATFTANPMASNSLCVTVHPTIGGIYIIDDVAIKKFFLT